MVFLWFSYGFPAYSRGVKGPSFCTMDAPNVDLSQCPDVALLCSSCCMREEVSWIRTNSRNDPNKKRKVENR